MEYLDYTKIIQKAVDYVEHNIKEVIIIDDIAFYIGFSKYHFQRVFKETMGMTLKRYIIKRKLQYALYDLTCGKRVIDVAFDYGFETHSGFTKAFRKIYLCPPKYIRLHAIYGYPEPICIAKIQKMKIGGIKMDSKIIEQKEKVLAGYTFNTTLENAQHTRDIPVFWDDIGIEGKGLESKMYHQLKPKKHCEYGICINLNEETDNFKYFFGVECEDEKLVSENMVKIIIKKGKYAVFSLPEVDKIEFVNSIKGTWKYIFENWLPESSYEIDDTRYEYEAYDEKCHPWNHDKLSMEIYIPIK